ncbi:N-methyltransferase [Colletotrichum sp. SAR11_59]|nr:N-methyltransferase [Colletotrichum sp. SAR11_59]
MLAEFKRRWRAFIENAYEESITHKKNGAIEKLLTHAKHGEYLTIEECMQTVDETLYANLDVTTSAVAWSHVLIAQNQAIQDEVRTEVRLHRQLSETEWEDYINRSDTLLAFSVLEASRLRPILAFSNPESAPADKLVGDIVVPRNTDVIVDSHAINVAHPFWINGTEFNPHRFEGLQPRQHDLIQSYMGGLILAPINFEQKRLKILDSGTFDGFWLAEASKLVAEPILVGADISPTMFPPSSSGSAGDLSFHVQSVAEPWPETWKGTFDLVHQRLVLAGTTPEVGKNAVRGLVELAKPGSGYVQLVEGALEHLTEEQKPKYPVLHRFQTLVARMLPGLGWNQRVGLQVREWLEAEGLQGVSEKIMEIPVGVASSDRRLGDIAKQNLLEVVEHFAMAAKGDG